VALTHVWQSRSLRSHLRQHDSQQRWRTGRAGGARTYARNQPARDSPAAFFFRVFCVFRGRKNQTPAPFVHSTNPSCAPPSGSFARARQQYPVSWGRCLELLELAVARDASHDGLARGFLAITRHLGKQFPDDDSRAADGTQAEQGTLLGKYPMNPPGAENLQEGEPRPSEQRVDNLLEIVAAFLR
jgi:hypothetical protein